MFGEAYKCDQCGRVTFTQQDRMKPVTSGGTPPEGWFGLSQVGSELQVWPSWHFDSIDCLAEFSDAWLHNLERSPAGGVTIKPAEPESDAPETVISEWDAEAEASGLPVE